MLLFVLCLLGGGLQAQNPRGGFFIYRRPPGNYTELVEFSSVESRNRLTTKIVSRSGEARSLQTAGILREFHYSNPARRPSLDEAKGVHAIITNALGEYPMFAPRLRPMEQHWANLVSFLEQKRQSEPPQETADAASAAGSGSRPPLSHPASAKEEDWVVVLQMLKVGNPGFASELMNRYPARVDFRRLVSAVSPAITTEQSLLAVRRRLADAKANVRDILASKDSSLYRNSLGNVNWRGFRQKRTEYDKALSAVSQNQEACDALQKALQRALTDLVSQALREGAAGALDVAGALGTFVEGAAARYPMELETAELQTRDWNLATLKAEQSEHEGREALAAGDLRKAAADVATGLGYFPASGPLHELQRDIKGIESRAAVLALEIRQLIDEGDFAQAATRIHELQGGTANKDMLETLKAELAGKEADHQARYTEAQKQEAGGHWKEAMLLYAALNRKEDQHRMALAYGTGLEQERAYAEALDFYRSAGMPERASALGETLLAQARLKEAAHDYPAALALFQPVKAEADIHRVQRKMEQQTQVAEGRRSEAAGDRQTALAWYRRAEAFEEVARVEEALAAQPMETAPQPEQQHPSVASAQPSPPEAPTPAPAPTRLGARIFALFGGIGLSADWVMKRYTEGTNK